MELQIFCYTVFVQTTNEVVSRRQPIAEMLVSFQLWVVVFETNVSIFMKPVKFFAKKVIFSVIQKVYSSLTENQI